MNVHSTWRRSKLTATISPTTTTRCAIMATCSVNKFQAPSRRHLWPCGAQIGMSKILQLPSRCVSHILNFSNPAVCRPNDIIFLVSSWKLGLLIWIVSRYCFVVPKEKERRSLYNGPATIIIFKSCSRWWGLSLIRSGFLKGKHTNVLLGEDTWSVGLVRRSL
jgi:hypothetical protein